MSNFYSGSFVEVLHTDNTVARFPEHIGCIGIVEHAPIHPSTWFTIKMTDGRSIKLQTTAMKYVAKNDVRTQMAQNILALPPLKIVSSNHTPNSDVPKENHRPRSNSNVGIAHFTKGVSVVILRTDNVLHRVPHLVGVVGIVKEVPVHPITWFKIEFPSGQVATFRPSAFKLNDGKDEEVYRPAKKPTAFSTSFNQTYTKKLPMKEKDKSNEYEYTVGMHVSIRSGELSGETGEVLKSSNGWIQVLTSLGRVAKRAHELDNSDDGSTPRTDNSGEHLTRDQSENLRMRPNHNLTNLRDQHGLKALKKAVFMSLHKDITTLGPKSNNRSPAKMDFNKRRYSDMPTSDNGIAPLYNLERQSVDCPFPLIPLHLRQAKRKRLQDYLDSESEATQSRPDLTFWLQEISQSFHSKSIYEEETVETGPSIRGTHRTKTTSSASCSSSSSSVVSTQFESAVPATVDFIAHEQKGTVTPNLTLSPTSTSAVTPDTHVACIPTILLSKPYALPTVGLKEKDEQRLRSNSISETDCEESLSPDVPSYDSSEFSIPSPLSLPPATTDCALHFLAMDEAMKIKNAVNVIHDEHMEICDNTLPNMENNHNEFESRNVPKNYSFVKKSTFSAIPNPVKVFLPRHYSSQSCPTFSPFQTSSFSPFKSNTLKSPTSQDQNGWKNYFASEKNFI